MDTYRLDVVVTRGGLVESRHKVHAAVVGAGDKLVARAGDPDAVCFWRSGAKPFQAIPFVAQGGVDDLGWGDDELALACASHGGEPEHVALAEAMLRDIGLEEGDLACGPHEPLSVRGARLVREGGGRISRLHNNGSGKHAAMLARAHTAGWPTGGYELPDHPVQTCVLETIASWCGVRTTACLLAVDGCGVPVVALPLERMARAYARLGAAAARGEEVPGRILHAMRARPVLVGGTERFDSAMIEDTGGRVVAKIGAEGMHSVTVPELGLGIAVKVEDGAQRAQYPAVVHVLQRVGALDERLTPRLADYLRKPIRNTRNEVVGEVRVDAGDGPPAPAPRRRRR
jgi:L-asparaginase II